MDAASNRVSPAFRVVLRGVSARFIPTERRRTVGINAVLFRPAACSTRRSLPAPSTAFSDAIAAGVISLLELAETPPFNMRKCP